MGELYKTVVRSVGHYLPTNVITNDKLSEHMDTNDAWIQERSGIKERRFISPGQTTSELGINAANMALEKAGLQPSDIDMIVAATLSPDYYFPGIGTLIQKKMGMKTIPALDIRAQCSGLVYGISTADAFLRTGKAKRILLVCAEVQSMVLDMSTRGREMAVLFGDGAGALILEAEKCTDAEFPTVKNKQSGVIDCILGGDGSGAEVLWLRSPGSATPGFVSPEMIENHEMHPRMEGKVVFKHAVTRMIETASMMLERNGLKPGDIDLLIPHQANLRINEMVREKLGVSPERVFNNIQKYGNTTAATIPICMSEAQEAGRLKKGDLVMTLAFGAGFTWGSNLIRW